MNCPPSHELSRALSDGADPAIDAHLAACPSCTKEWTATVEMIELARQFTAPLPSSAHREGVRSALLAASRTQSLTDDPPARRAESRVDRRMVIAAAIAVAASVGLYLIVRPPSSAPGHVHGSIHALAGAQYVEVASAPDERIFLTEGSIDVQVSPLHKGERFRIILGDAEVEVHGTRFIATAEHGSLVGVVVDHGVVEVRPRDSAMRMLHAGESWRPTPTAAAKSVAPSIELSTETLPSPPVVYLPAPIAPVAPAQPKATEATKRETAAVPQELAHVAEPRATEPEATERKATEPEATERKATEPEATERKATEPEATEPEATDGAMADATPQERAYDSGWTAMRTGKFDDAATAFRKVLLLDPTGPLAEDATYWNAVALARSKQNPRAIAAFRDFLDHYAHAKRAGEASAMLGWLLVSAGDRDEAVRRFKAAVSDADDAVRKSAQAGLDALTVK